MLTVGTSQNRSPSPLFSDSLSTNLPVAPGLTQLNHSARALVPPQGNFGSSCCQRECDSPSIKPSSSNARLQSPILTPRRQCICAFKITVHSRARSSRRQSVLRAHSIGLLNYPVAISTSQLAHQLTNPTHRNVIASAVVSCHSTHRRHYRKQRSLLCSSKAHFPLHN